ncbi:ggact.2 [Symbiodinium sp. CCMP2456]|nr:ggact.2 [Symbiodinium sp. CCMP2456]
MGFIGPCWRQVIFGIIFPLASLCGYDENSKAGEWFPPPPAAYENQSAHPLEGGDFRTGALDSESSFRGRHPGKTPFELAAGYKSQTIGTAATAHQIGSGYDYLEMYHVAEQEEQYTRRQHPVPWADQGQGARERWESPRRRAEQSPRRRGGVAKKGKGKRAQEANPGKGKTPPATTAVPDITQLPEVPKAARPPLPKQGESTAAGPTEDRKLLEQLMEQLTVSGTELPAGLAAMVNQYQAENHRLHGRQLHQLVARQTQARREIAKLDREAQAFEGAWTNYMVRLSELVQNQLAERQKHIEERENAKAAWQAQLADATSQLAASTGPAAMSKPPTTEAEMDAEDEAIDQAIEDEADQRRARAQAAEQFQAMLQMLQSQPQLVRSRDGSRTPRRRKDAKEAEAVDSSPELAAAIPGAAGSLPAAPGQAKEEAPKLGPQ